MQERLSVNGKDYALLRLLGHGKGGYSYLALREGERVVLKQIHHEPCDYYSFGNKIEAERCDYERLRRAGIRIPRMLDIDLQAERIVKEYIEGQTVAELLSGGRTAEPYLPQVREMAAQAKAAGLNIDYYPTNFVIREGLLYYVDYECNAYSDEWSFERWGAQYWVNPPEGALQRAATPPQPRRRPEKRYRDAVLVKKGVLHELRACTSGGDMLPYA